MSDPDMTEITLADVVHAKRIATRDGISLMAAMQASLERAPEEILAGIGKAFSRRVVSSGSLHEMQADFQTLPFTEAVKLGCLALRDETGSLLVVAKEPFSTRLERWVEDRFEENFAWGLIDPADLEAYFSAHEQTLRAMESLAGYGDTNIEADIGTSLTLQAINEHSSPVVKLVDSTLYDALKAAASDIHIESTPTGLSVKYRIDGVLVHISQLPGTSFAEQVVSRIKVIAELDIAERRIPQDGRFKINIEGRAIDFRVSIMPSLFGEDAVLRILDRGMLTEQMAGLRLESLGFDGNTIARLRALADEPYGMFLVTGPTGSGKTTTLYAALSEINRGQDKIVTIEDPVEYQLPGILQIPVNEKKGLTFSRGLRSILRHDPDKIMVGEIRDGETAQIAVQAALTGHLVFTTVHANSTLDAIGRFLHMGIDAYSFVSAANGIVAQRLIRLICTNCSTETTPEQELVVRSGLADRDTSAFRFMSGRGCGHCRGTGYRGRKAIAEILVMDDDLRRVIAGQEPGKIKQVAQARGVRFLRSAAIELVAAGLTTLQEANRVTQV